MTGDLTDNICLQINLARELMRSVRRVIAIGDDVSSTDGSILYCLTESAACQEAMISYAIAFAAGKARAHFQRLARLSKKVIFRKKRREIAVPLQLVSAQQFLGARVAALYEIE